MGVVDIEEKEKIAGEFMSLPFLTTAILVPFNGILIDKYGQRIKILLVSGLICLVSHVLLLTIKNGLPLILLGIGYSMFGAVTWTTVPFIVIEKYTVSDFSLMGVIF